MTPYVLELIDFTLAPIGSGLGIQGGHFTVAPGDVCAVISTQPDDGHQFLRALATLVRPVKGVYVFKGQHYNLHRCCEMLDCKQKIGFMAPEARLISNLTLRQNLLLRRWHQENRLDIDLDGETMALCEGLGIADKLDQRPATIKGMDIQAAVIVRELAKRPELLLIDQPESFVEHARFEVVVRIFRQLVADGLPVVFLSYDERLLSQYVNRKVCIAQQRLSAVAVQGPSSPTLSET